MSEDRRRGSSGVSRVGKYMLLETLGEGAFGKVKLAVDERDGQQYAVKIMRKQDIQQQELTLQVRREIAVMKALRHPNIVNLHEVLNSKSSLYMVMDLVQGGELFDAVAEQGRLHENDARMYFQQLADGIYHCHMRRVYHRDIKPENLLLSPDKKILKITDFGLSSIKGANSTTELLHTTMGSPHYIAPEIITSAAKGYEGSKVDVWASGVVLFGLLAGYLPFDEERTRDLYKAIVHQPVKYPAHFSPGAVELISAMLVKDPERRVTFEEVKTFPWFLENYHPIKSRDTASPRNSKRRKRRSKKSKGEKQSESGHHGSDEGANETERRGSSAEHKARGANDHDQDESKERDVEHPRISLESQSTAKSAARSAMQGSRDEISLKTPSNSRSMKKSASGVAFSEDSPQSVMQYTPTQGLHGKFARREFSLNGSQKVERKSTNLLGEERVEVNEEEKLDSDAEMMERKLSDRPLSSEEKLMISSHPPPPPLPKGPSVESSVADEENFLSLKRESEHSNGSRTSRAASLEAKCSPKNEGRKNSSHCEPVSKLNSGEGLNKSQGEVKESTSEPHLPELKIKSSLLDRANQLFALVTRRIGGSYQVSENRLPRSQGMRREALDEAAEMVAGEECLESSEMEVGRNHTPEGPHEIDEDDSRKIGVGLMVNNTESETIHSGPTENRGSGGLFKPVPSIFAPLAKTASLIENDSPCIDRSASSKTDSAGITTKEGFNQSLSGDESKPRSTVNFSEDDEEFLEDTKVQLALEPDIANRVPSISVLGPLGQSPIGFPYSPNGKSNFLMQRQLQRKVARGFGLPPYGIGTRKRGL